MRELLWAIGMAVGVAAMFIAARGTGEPTSGAFATFVAGQVVFLACGSGLFLQLYGRLRRAIKRPFVREPLDAMAEHRWLLTGLHVVVFGGLIVFTVIAHVHPATQARLVGVVRDMAGRPDNPLGLAAVAYRSKSVLAAAAATLMVNFVLGTLLTVTLPSLAMPGVGVLIVLLRACGVGLILAPTTEKLLDVMAWHSGTLLIETEGYILAAFFGLMVPVYLLSPSKGEMMSERYIKSVALNLKGIVLVLIVLTVAALYEAPEVIGQMP